MKIDIEKRPPAKGRVDVASAGTLPPGLALNVSSGFIGGNVIGGEKEIPALLLAAHSRAEDIEKSLACLQEDLSPALRPPSENGEGFCVEDASTDIGSSIRRLLLKLYELNSFVRQMHGRLEI